MLTLFLASVGLFQPAACELEGAGRTYDQEQQIECGWVTVPRAANDPKMIRLWVARVKANGPSKQPDPIIFINGGPGMATVDTLLPELEDWKMLTALRKDRDVIFYDQRGTGRSEDAMCPSLDETLDDIDDAGLAPVVALKRSKAAFAACRRDIEATGGNLNAYTTMNSVADLDLIRKAFGATKVNHLSVSYGTLLSMQAMRMHPGTIRSSILQSPYPPNSVSWAEQASSAAASYILIDQACSRQPTCKTKFGSLVPKLDETLRKLELAPIKAGNSFITGRKFAKALWSLSVRSSTVRFVPEAIHRAHAGDVDLIKRMAGKSSASQSFGERSPAQAFAIMCHEGGRTTAWYARARELYPSLVPEGLNDGWDQMCETYRPGYVDPTFFAPLASDIPTLIYAGSFDPATPLIDAYQATRFLTKATLVEVKSASHSPMAVDDCTLGIGLAFLRAPDSLQELKCLKQRTRADFAKEGLDGLFPASVK